MVRAVYLFAVRCGVHYAFVRLVNESMPHITSNNADYYYSGIITTSWHDGVCYIYYVYSEVVGKCDNWSCLYTGEFSGLFKGAFKHIP